MSGLAEKRALSIGRVSERTSRSSDDCTAQASGRKWPATGPCVAQERTTAADRLSATGTSRQIIVHFSMSKSVRRIIAPFRYRAMVNASKG